MNELIDITGIHKTGIDKLTSYIEMLENYLLYTKSINECGKNDMDNQLKIIHEIKKNIFLAHKNTVHFPIAIDAEALRFALCNQSNIDKVEIVAFYKGKECSIHELINDGIKPTKYILRVHYSRYAMNGNGYHVGYENVIFVIPLHPKRKFEIHGSPYMLSSLIAFPNQFYIESKDFPPEDKPTNESHSDDCPNRNRKKKSRWEECDCLDFFEGYYPPDDDYFETEFQYIIDMILDDPNSIPEAEFHIDEDNNRIWELGDDSISLDNHEELYPIR